MAALFAVAKRKHSGLYEVRTLRYQCSRSYALPVELTEANWIEQVVELVQINV